METGHPPATPYATIAIPTFNAAVYLAETIESAIAQTRSDIEIVVVDNRSTDTTHAVVESFDDPRIRFIRNERNVGMAGNWNRAASHAQGRFVTVLHADDTLEPGFVETLGAELEAHPEANAVVSNVGLFDSESRRLPVRRLRHMDFARAGEFGKVERRKLLQGNTIWSCCWLARPRLFEHLQFDEGMSWAADWDFWLRAVATAGPIRIRPERLSNYRVHSESLTFSPEVVKRRMHEEAALIDRAVALSKDPERDRQVADRAFVVRFVGSWVQMRALGHREQANIIRDQLRAARGRLAFPTGLARLAVDRASYAKIRDFVDQRRDGSRGAASEHP
jgi:glycosyltransferase involved in cell wall biosynthesis